MTSPGETAMDHQMAAQDDLDMRERIADPTDDAERSMTLAVPGAEPEPIPESPAVSDTAAMSARWHEIQAMFVDDPRASAEMAAGLVDDSIRAFTVSVREQQDSLLATWHGEDAGTEELRTAVQHYRALGTRLAGFSQPGT